VLVWALRGTEKQPVKTRVTIRLQAKTEASARMHLSPAEWLLGTGIGLAEKKGYAIANAKGFFKKNSISVLHRRCIEEQLSSTRSTCGVASSFARIRRRYLLVANAL
jgi:hypothetical protein